MNGHHFTCPFTKKLSLCFRGLLYRKLIDDFDNRSGIGHDVEMQSGNAVIQQFLALFCSPLYTDLLNFIRGGIQFIRQFVRQIHEKYLRKCIEM